MSKFALPALLLGLLLAGIAISYFVPDNYQALAEALRAFGPLSLVIISASYIVACVFMFPGSILTIAAGYLAAVLWPESPLTAVAAGTVAVSFGSVAGACAAFLLGRTFLRSFAERQLREYPRFSAIDRAVGRQGFKLTLLLRLSPAFPFTFLNYALGLTALPFRDYLLASWIGMLPGTVMYVYIGTTVSSITSSAAAPDEATGYGRTALVVLGLIATVILVTWITRIARRATAEQLEEAPAENLP